MTDAPDFSRLLDEQDHQALDLLEELDEAREGIFELRLAWPIGGDDELLAALAGDLDLDPTELRAALVRVDAVLDRVLPPLAIRVLGATDRVLERARDDAGPPSPLLPSVPESLRPLEAIRTQPVRAALAGGSLPDPAAVDEVRGDIDRAVAIIERDPSHAFCVRPAIATLIQVLGLPRGGALEGLLEARQRLAPTPLGALDRASEVASRLARAAHLPAVLMAEGLVPEAYVPAHPALARFRLECVEGAGPEVRATALAGDAPELRKLAESLVGGEVSHRARIRTFDELARKAREADRKEPDPTRGRKFTWQHAILLVLLLGFSLYYYLWR